LSKKKRNILVLSSWYPNRTHPTLGNFNEKFSQAIAIYHHVFALHVVADSNMKENEEIIFSEINGVKTLHIYFKKTNSDNIFSKISKAFKFLKYYFKGYNLVQEKMGKPDIVHLNILYPVGIIALIFKYFYKIPYIITENWTGYLPSHRIYQGSVIEFLSRKVAKNAACLVPVTQNLKENMQKLGFESSYEIVPNVTDVKHFYPKTKKEKNEKKIILHVSTLDDAHKNISGILRVIKKIESERNDFELHIVGDGDANPHKKYAVELGINENFLKFYGEMTPEQIASKMRESHLFVLFSNYENLPCVMVEAFASGLPVVSSAAGGVAEHLSNDKGIVINPKDEAALYKSLKSVLDNLENYDEDNLHNYAVENFSYESVGKRFSEIYNSILN
jgi:L-malate glycosyltransferase